MDRDIAERTFKFGVRIIKASSHMPENRVGRVLGGQLLRCGTSIGANVEEAIAAYSTDDFTFKMSLALKEARETHYWLRLLRETVIGESERLAGLLTEADEIMRILGSVVVKMRKKQKRSE
ncbi:MAG TPA: four helix bundle protein [Bacteroidota bacterium]|nr:four helix bundle protein [Bacteroidota bacterium]